MTTGPTYCGRCGAELPAAHAVCAACGFDSVLDAEGLLPGTVVAGRYEVVEQVGAGGMGRVYRAVQRPLGTEVCIKTLHEGVTGSPHFEARFEREARALARLRHPNVVAVLDYGHDLETSTFLVMEYVEGRNLARVAKREAPMSASRAVQILAQVCDALTAAHAQGVIHRDLKPSNIMLTDLPDRADFVKVLDFGSALIQDAGSSDRLTHVGTVIGTPVYMAPEYILGHPIDPRVDVYAVGVLLYLLLCGSAPFRGVTQAVFAQHVGQAPEHPRERNPRADVSDDLARVVLGALEKDPDARFPSAAALKAAMLEALRSSATEDSEDAPLSLEIELSSVSALVSATTDATRPRAPSDRKGVVAVARGVLGLAREVTDRLVADAASVGGVPRPLPGGLAVHFEAGGAEGEATVAAIRWAMAAAARESRHPIRVGIHAWTAGSGPQQATALDDFDTTATTSVADLLAAAAPAGRVLVSGAVARRSPRDLRLVPRHRPPGVEGPVFALADPTDPHATATRLPFVGRALAHRSLVELAVSAESGHVCLLTGPDGAGKSRLVAEVASQASRIGVVWALVTARARTRLGPDHPLAAVAALGWASQDASDPRLSARVARILCGQPEPEDQILEGVAGQRRLVSAALDWAFDRPVGCPVVVVLDELQAADELTWALAERLVGAAPEGRLSVVLCVRSPEDLPFSLPPLGIRIALGPLADEDMRSIARIHFGPRLDEETLALVAAKSQGNPRLAGEVFRAVQSGQGALLDRLAGLAHAEAVDALLEARLEALSAPALEVLAASSVLGSEPSEAEVLELVGGADQSMAALVELESTGLLDRGLDNRVRFALERLRRVALRGLSARERRALHEAAALVISGAPNAFERLAELGEHLLAAGQGLAALDPLLGAAREAEQQGRPEAAVRCLRLAAEAGRRAAGARSEDVLAAYRDRGRLLLELGRHERAERVLRSGLRRARAARSVALAADMLRLHGLLAAATGQPDRGMRRLEKAMDLARKHGEIALAARTCLDLGSVAEREGDEARAADDFRFGLELLEGLPDDDALDVRLELCKRAGRLEQRTRNLTAAVALFADALDVAERRGDRYQAAGLLGNLGAAFARQAESAKAFELTARALAVSTELGDDFGVARQGYNLALIRLDQGELEEARGLLERARRAGLRAGWRAGITMMDEALARL